MADYVLADGAEDDIEAIARYTIDRWGNDQARRYADALSRHFEALAANDVKTRLVFAHWPELRVSRCQHHFVFTLQRTAEPIAILVVFHESMDLAARLRERMDRQDRS